VLGHLINDYICALRGKNRRNQKLKRVLVLQLTGRFRIRFVQTSENRSNSSRIGPAPERKAARVRTALSPCSAGSPPSRTSNGRGL